MFGVWGTEVRKKTTATTTTTIHSNNQRRTDSSNINFNTHMNVLLSARALATATHVITGIGQYISLGLELSRCCAYLTRRPQAHIGETNVIVFVALRTNTQPVLGPTYNGDS